MSGCVVSDIKTRAKGESLYIRFNTDADELLKRVTNNDTVNSKKVVLQKS
jgi:hypothetical protein